jgi:hypothetical protein
MPKYIPILSALKLTFQNPLSKQEGPPAGSPSFEAKGNYFLAWVKRLLTSSQLMTSHQAAR